MTKTMPTDSGMSFWIASRVALSLNRVNQVTEAIRKEHPKVALAGAAW
jgi:hypothetical protein